MHHVDLIESKQITARGWTSQVVAAARGAVFQYTQVQLMYQYHNSTRLSALKGENTANGGWRSIYYSHQMSPTSILGRCLMLCLFGVAMPCLLVAVPSVKPTGGTRVGRGICPTAVVAVAAVVYIAYE